MEIYSYNCYNKKAQLGETLTWVVAFLIIFFIMFLFLIASISLAGKGNTQSINFKSFFKVGSGVVDYNGLNPWDKVSTTQTFYSLLDEKRIPDGKDTSLRNSIDDFSKGDLSKDELSVFFQDIVSEFNLSTILNVNGLEIFNHNGYKCDYIGRLTFITLVSKIEIEFFDCNALGNRKSYGLGSWSNENEK